MKENLNKKLAFPDLADCPATDGECALTGCFFENAIKRIDPEKLGFIKAREVRDQLIDMGTQCGCKRIYNILNIHFRY